MAWTNAHIPWLVDTKRVIRTAEGKEIAVWELRHQPDPPILSAWADHFRNHYCRDHEIDVLRDGTGHSRSEYLEALKFPDRSQGFGPLIRAGDFSEILVADFLQFVLHFQVPRTRFVDKGIRNESKKGCDVIGFKCLDPNTPLPDDALAIFESKAQFSGTAAKPKLQEAVDGSAKDLLRKAESLNAIKQRLLDEKNVEQGRVVARFQNKADKPYQEYFGAVALFETDLVDEQVLETTTAQNHHATANLTLVVIHGQEMMRLTHDLYKLAAEQAEQA